MGHLKLGIFGTSLKENEFRLPLHPDHIERIDPELCSSIFLERDYGSRFGATEEQLESLVGGLRSQDELINECDVILLPKPLPEDIARLRPGQTHWGWPHCVQDPMLTQHAIDHKLTLIAWEAMNHWQSDGSYGVHVFHKNNELAGYCSVLQALQLIGRTGEYGKKMTAAVISFGATGRGAVSALNAMGILDVTVMTHREPSAVESPIHSTTMAQYGTSKHDPSRLVVLTEDGDRIPLERSLADHDIVVNCVLQDPDAPYMFVCHDDVKLFRPGSMIVDVSCDTGMGFEWARPTSFEDPVFMVDDTLHYYAVDHSPSYLWDSSTWEISEALLPYIPTVMAGPGAWDEDEVIKRAIEIRDGVIQNPKILSFQNRSEDYPHAERSS
ncbi:MAG: N(5)-(carboxyethyl)ornithine synthase [Actinomycetota bacterium]